MLRNRNVTLPLRESFSRFLCAIVVLGATGCSFSGPPKQVDPDELWDPLEPANRVVHSANNTMDEYVLEPLARGYNSVMPDRAQRSIRNFFETMRYPSNLVSDLLQFKFTQAAEHSGRFAVNITVGVLGLFDVATDWGLPAHREDFAVALAYHDIPPGPYVVLPFLGPSTVRDTVGLVVDGFLDPFSWLVLSDSGGSAANKVAIGSQVLWALQSRADLIETIETSKKAGMDYYGTMQAAYYQYRLGVLYDGNVPNEDDKVNSDEEFGTDELDQ